MEHAAQQSETWAVVPAAGAGVRFGGDVPKQFCEMNGLPLLHHTLEALWASGAVQGLVVAVPADRVPDAGVLPPALTGLEVVRVCAGGADRTASVAAALGHLPETCGLVLIHDGARPAVAPALVERVVAGARAHGACVPVLAMGDTVKRLDGQGRVVETLDRGPLRRVQTPQGFRTEIIRGAYDWLRAQPDPPAFTDDAALVEAAGGEVFSVAGDEANIKVTVPADLQRLAPAVPRVGFGYDVHRLVAGRPLFLGGLEIPHPKGLLGHSDADVALHALIDALLGAAGLGDIGRLFPDTDPAWAGADSKDLLRRVAARVTAAGFTIRSCDLTIVAEEPRLAAHLQPMARLIADLLGLPASAVGTKATTEEGLGVSGGGQAIAAHALAVLAERTGPGGRGTP